MKSNHLKLTIVLLSSFTLCLELQAGKELLIEAKGGGGKIYEKLVVVSANALFRATSDSTGDAKKLDGWSILYRLKTENGGNETSDGKYRFGDRNGNPIGYVDKKFVKIWNTRTVLEPIGTTEERAFSLYSDPKAEVEELRFTGADGAQGRNDKRLALVTESEDSTSGIFNVIAWTGPVFSDDEEATLVDIANLKLDVAFVIDVSLSTEPLQDALGGIATQKATDLIGIDPTLKSQIRFALVTYDDFNSEQPGLVGTRTNIDLTPGSGFTSFQTEVAKLKPGEINADDKPEDLGAAIIHSIEKLSWHKSSVKHIILLTDATGKFNDKSVHASVESLRAGRVWEYGEILPGKMGLTINQILSRAMPSTGSGFQRALKSFSIHAVNGHDKPALDQYIQLVRDEAGDEADEVVEILRNIKNDRDLAKNFFLGDSLLVSRIVSDIYTSEKGKTQKQEQLKKLAGDRFYAEFNAWEDRESAIKEIAGELALNLKAAYDALKVAREGELADVKAGKFNTSFYEVVNKSKDLAKTAEENAARVAFARAMNASGRDVAKEKFMVFRDEIVKLEGSFTSLYDTFQNSAQKAQRQNSKDILDKLKAALATAATGDSLSADDTLADIIDNSLPILTPALQVSAEKIASMSNEAFQRWLDQLETAQTTCKDLLERDEWTAFKNPTGAATKGAGDYTFILITDLP